MISMFDADRSGTIDVQEFERLFAYINQWLACFKAYDRDGSGAIEEAELAAAFTQMGFRFSQQFVKFLITINDQKNHREISVDQFIVLCVKVQRFTDAFRQRDAQQQGMITIGFEDFLGLALNCTN
jgi:Ca2+-binding EF-hand superfamily protein